MPRRRVLTDEERRAKKTALKQRSRLHKSICKKLTQLSKEHKMEYALCIFSPTSIKQRTRITRSHRFSKYIKSTNQLDTFRIATDNIFNLMIETDEHLRLKSARKASKKKEKKEERTSNEGTEEEEEELEEEYNEGKEEEEEEEVEDEESDSMAEMEEDEDDGDEDEDD